MIKCRVCRGSGAWAGVRGCGIPCEACEGTGWCPLDADDREEPDEYADDIEPDDEAAAAYGRWLDGETSAWDRVQGDAEHRTQVA